MCAGKNANSDDKLALRMLYTHIHRVLKTHVRMDGGSCTSPDINEEVSYAYEARFDMCWLNISIRVTPLTQETLLASCPCGKICGLYVYFVNKYKISNIPYRWVCAKLVQSEATYHTKKESVTNQHKNVLGKPSSHFIKHNVLNTN